MRQIWTVPRRAAASRSGFVPQPDGRATSLSVSFCALCCGWALGMPGRCRSIAAVIRADHGPAAADARDTLLRAFGAEAQHVADKFPGQASKALAELAHAYALVAAGAPHRYRGRPEAAGSYAGVHRPWSGPPRSRRSDVRLPSVSPERIEAKAVDYGPFQDVARERLSACSAGLGDPVHGAGPSPRWAGPRSSPHPGLSDPSPGPVRSAGRWQQRGGVMSRPALAMWNRIEPLMPNGPLCGRRWAYHRPTLPGWTTRC